LEGDKRFLMINKGIVVNMDRIRTIEKGSCTMTDGTVFPIKVRKASQITQTWQNYIFDSLREGQK
ncbi:MAG: DNA-binding response regulator, partial [Lachnospiraceae bacterium]|nr:DNA-binding response regulator [Lachnospiraceae bacterium]